MPISSAFPFVFDLSDEEATTFLAEVVQALNGKSLCDGLDQLDATVNHWKNIAACNKAEAERKRRNELHDRIRDLERKLQQAAEAYERLDARNTELKKKIEDAGDRMDVMRHTVRRANERCVMIDPKDLVQPLGGDLWKEGL